jgi:cell division protein FtsL
MARVNLILLIVVITCALATVAANNRARKAFSELEREQGRMRDLEVEWGQLQLEQSTWANNARIEKIARQTLRMKAPEATQIIVIEAATPLERK